MEYERKGEVRIGQGRTGKEGKTWRTRQVPTTQDNDDRKRKHRTRKDWAMIDRKTGRIERQGKILERQ
jgi:hypothetical protein